MSKRNKKTLYSSEFCTKNSSLTIELPDPNIYAGRDLSNKVLPIRSFFSLFIEFTRVISLHDSPNEAVSQDTSDTEFQSLSVTLPMSLNVFMSEIHRTLMINVYLKMHVVLLKKNSLELHISRILQEHEQSY